jgi:surfeit locus 1 family protein
MSRRSLTVFLLAVLFAGVTTGLGFWQLSRLHGRREANARALALRALPAITLGRAGAPGSGTMDNRLVEATGQFDRTEEIVLRGYVYQGAPGVRIVTPLRLAGTDTALLVLRGFVPAADAVHADLAGLDEPGELTLHGVAFTIPISPDSGGRLEDEGQVTWRRLDLAALRASLPYPIYDSYLIEARDSIHPPLPIRLEPPPLDDGPHLSYAIQWFAFAITGLTVGCLLAFRPTAPPLSTAAPTLAASPPPTRPA